MKASFGPAALVELIWGGLLLRPALYRDASREALTRPCLAVAVIGGIATGLGRASGLGLVPSVAIVLYVLITLASVLLESLLVWGFAALWLRPSTRFGEVVRPLAVGAAPRVVYLILALGEGTGWVEPLGALWLLAAFVVSVEAVLRRGWWAAVGIAVLIGAVRWALFAMIMEL